MNAIRNTVGVRCREVVRFSEGPLREVRLYMFVVHPPRCQPRSTKGSRLFGAAAGGSTGPEGWIACIDTHARIIIGHSTWSATSLGTQAFPVYPVVITHAQSLSPGLPRFSRRSPTYNGVRVHNDRVKRGRPGF